MNLEGVALLPGNGQRREKRHCIGGWKQVRVEIRPQYPAPDGSKRVRTCQTEGPDPAALQVCHMGATT